MRNRNRRKVEVILPRAGKFKGTPCVYYSVYNPRTDRMERYRTHITIVRLFFDIRRQRHSPRVTGQAVTSIRDLPMPARSHPRRRAASIPRWLRALNCK